MTDLYWIEVLLAVVIVIIGRKEIMRDLKEIANSISKKGKV